MNIKNTLKQDKFVKTFSDLENNCVNILEAKNSHFNYDDEEEDDEIFEDALDYIDDEFKKQKLIKNDQDKINETTKNKINKILSWTIGIFNDNYSSFKNSISTVGDKIKDISNEVSWHFNNKENLEETGLVVSDDIKVLLMQLKNYRDIEIEIIDDNNPKFREISKQKYKQKSLNEKELNFINKDNLDLLSSENWKNLNGKQLNQILNIFEDKSFQATNIEKFFYIKNWQKTFLRIEKDIENWEKKNQPSWIKKNIFWKVKGFSKSIYKSIGAWIISKNIEKITGFSINNFNVTTFVSEGLTNATLNSVLNVTHKSEFEKHIEKISKEKKIIKDEWIKQKKILKKKIIC